MRKKKQLAIFLLLLIAIVILAMYTPAFSVLNNKIILLFKQETKSMPIDKQDETFLANNNSLETMNYFDPQYNFYYTLLTTSQKEIYKEIYANALNLIQTFTPNEKVDVSQIKDAIEAVFYDHPELFWLDTKFTYKYDSNNKCIQISLYFNETINNIEVAKQNFADVTNKIIANAKTLKTDFDKEKYVHDVIIKNATYNKNALSSQSAYSALVNRQTVCAGYAKAFQYIMNKLEIPTYFVVGYAKEDHGWNIIKLEDGYYNVDLTWDDNKDISYNYFNKTDQEFSLTHTRLGQSRYLPKCLVNTYTYDAPKNIQDFNSDYNKYVTISDEINDDLTSINKDANLDLNNLDYGDSSRLQVSEDIELPSEKKEESQSQESNNIISKEERDEYYE